MKSMGMSQKDTWSRNRARRKVKGKQLTQVHIGKMLIDTVCTCEVNLILAPPLAPFRILP